MTSSQESEHDGAKIGKSASSKLFIDGKKPLDIIIVGGSCAGLFAGILLKRQGHNIHIVESARSSEREGLASGVGLAAHVKRFFDENDRLREISFGTPNEFMYLRDWDMSVKQTRPLNYRMTTWNAVYYRLRANFDGLVSPYCPDPPVMYGEEGKGLFDTGKRALRVDQAKDGVSVVVEDARSGKKQTYEADVAIAADGANSNIRRQLHPRLTRTEPGYVLWRGTVPTKDLPQHLVDKLDTSTTLYTMQHSYSIIYTVPGGNGSLEPGERIINFAWYTWPASHSIPEILTDTQGHTHRHNLPKGLMRPEIWAAQVAQARKIFHPDLISLIEKIEEPFVTVISTIASPRARYYSDRLFLIGDALTQLQPNTGQGTNFAAMDAMLLASVFRSEISPQEWEDQVLELGRNEQARAVAFGAKFLCGPWGRGFAEMRYQWRLMVLRVWKWWIGRAGHAKL